MSAAGGCIAFEPRLSMHYHQFHSCRKVYADWLALIELDADDHVFLEVLNSAFRALAGKVICSYVSVSMKWYSSPELYKYCISLVSIRARATLSPARKVLSIGPES